MRLAIVNNERIPAAPGLAGVCPACNAPVIARCGTLRVHHWAHRGVRMCDEWWEPETEWHRAWKHHFPEDWQEKLSFASSGEKHIADVRTAHGLTIEFQHSYIRLEERTAREDFYGDMIWVVDGSRLARDLPRFSEGTRSWRPISKGVHLHQFPDEMFPRAWLMSVVPVVFDFSRSAPSPALSLPIARRLWCLLPRSEAPAVIVSLAREDFIRWVQEGTIKRLLGSVAARANNLIARERAASELQAARHRAALIANSIRRKRSYSRRWPTPRF